MAEYTIFLQFDAWTESLHKVLDNISHVDDMLSQLADDVVYPILTRHYDASGIKQGGVYGGRHAGLLKPAITKRGAFGNITKMNNGTLTVGVAYEQLYYAKWVIEGRGPVTPKRKKMLHWIDPDTGKDVFAKRAGPAPEHPIYFLTGSELDEVRADLIRLIEEKVK